jgi:hypothetical protein
VSAINKPHHSQSQDTNHFSAHSAQTLFISLSPPKVNQKTQNSQSLKNIQEYSRTLTNQNHHNRHQGHRNCLNPPPFQHKFITVNLNQALKPNQNIITIITQTYQMAQHM